MNVDDDDDVAVFMQENESWSPSNSDETRREEVNKKRSREEVASKNVTDSNHLWIERERRKKMRNMYDILHSLLPHLPSKADSSTILDEAVKQIQNLQQTLKKLEKQKQEKLKSIYQFRCESSTINSQRHPYKSREVFISGEGSSSSNSVNAFSTPRPTVAFQSWYSSNVVLNICGDEAQFCICATRKPGLLTTVAFVMEKHSIALIYANIFCNGIGYMIQAHVKRVSHEFQDAIILAEETYKQAAEEIKKLIS
ncbi:transcription factor bHLH95-like [Cicer arietinum]|uniref:Transcription factor bHLH95-like n=1 Tax=Cicer arietinum TaxID=3827 RepID=A0A1S2YJE6_CICAR|nr:transcription factor bHLH95-like [Cicer arietinum]